MIRLLLSLVLLSTSAGALAQSRAYVQQMSCGQAQGLVASQGAVVLYSGPSAYDRFVTDSSFCVRPERTEPAWIGTADTPQCFVGYRCVDRQTRTR